LFGKQIRFCFLFPSNDSGLAILIHSNPFFFLMGMPETLNVSLTATH